ncbi:MAG: exodeoxyribonuclease VII large subunit [Candidatus Competibacteraceae bacterium]|nr:MAG: exodeoxyribonuclease VII large subunit [Candidatus Competibacteraceae bacterium]
MAATLLPDRDVYNVSRLNQAVRALLEGEFSLLWVQGEVSNLSRPSSGHLYFSLKDAKAQIRCALFQNRACLFRDCPRNGQQVLVRGRVSLYEPRGDFQLIVEYVEEAGAGALRRAYDELRLRLEREGLFAPDRKKVLPRFPRRIGVITSPSGAALRDVLTTLRRRSPNLPILLYPVPVQGDGAAERIAAAIRLASERQDCDLLLLARGGGSLEDLQAFNEEIVARAIIDCAIPLVSGIGHETDVTIADFAADLRAPTPTAAAELSSPDRQEWLRATHLLTERLERALWRRLSERRQRLHPLVARLERLQPRRRLHDHAQQLDELDQRLRQALNHRLGRERLRLVGLETRLRAQVPVARLRSARQQLRALALRQDATLRQCFQATHQRLKNLSSALHALSPLATLKRGYAIVRRYPDGSIVRRTDPLQIGDPVEVLLGSGRVRCEITAIDVENRAPSPDFGTHPEEP